MWSLGEPIRIVVPGTPKPLPRNRHRIMNRKGGGPAFVVNYMPKEAAEEQSSIRWIANQAMNGRAPIDGTIDLRVVAFMPIPASWSKKKQAVALADQVRPTGRPDADNIIKLLKDCLTGVVLRDDSIITDMAMWKRYSSSPRLLVEVRSLVWSD